MLMFCMAFQEVKRTQQLGWNTQSIVLSCCFLTLSKVIIFNYYLTLIESFYLQIFISIKVKLFLTTALILISTCLELTRTNYILFIPYEKTISDQIHLIVQTFPTILHPMLYSMMIKESVRCKCEAYL